MKDIEISQVRDNYNDETACILGQLEINGVSFPSPTTALVMFFDLIQSPFITGAKPQIIDVYDALYVLKFRDKALSDVSGMFQAKKYLDEYEKLIEKSPEYLDVVLKYREKFEARLQKFHSMAAQFGETLGIIHLEEVGKQIASYVNSCFGGFEMIPKNTDEEHKKKDLTVNG